MKVMKKKAAAMKAIGHEGDEEEGRGGGPRNEGHEGYEGHEEEGRGGGPCNEGHEGHEGYEGDEEEGRRHEGHEGHEGYEEVRLYCVVSGARTPRRLLPKHN